VWEIGSTNFKEGKPGCFWLEMKREIYTDILKTMGHCLEQYDRFEGLILHPKPLDQKLITKVISSSSQPILYEELQTMPSSEYSFSNVAEPPENSAFSNDLELIKEKNFLTS